MMRNYGLRIACTAALYLFFCVATAFANGIGAIALTWTEDPQTTQTITWQTDPAADAYVEYSEAGMPDATVSAVKMEKAATTAFETDVRQNAVHTITLRGLKPGTRYVYRLGDGKVWPRDGVFKTERPAELFKFLLFGDSQSTDYNVWKTSFNAAYRANRDARFFVNVGDLVDNGQKQAEWDSWFAAVAAHSGNLPLVPVVGNHETYTPTGSFSLPRYFTQQFMLPQNGPAALKGQVYSFDYGAVHFVVLDSQFGEERQFLPDSLARQKAWLEQDLAATDKLWKIVFMHRPPYHNRVGEQNPDATAQFVPIFDTYGVDVVFSGHDHVNARTPKMRGGAPHAEGTVYVTTGRSGTKVYDKMVKKAWNEQFFNPLDQPTYSVVTVTGNVLYVQVLKQDGSAVDEWSLTKIHQ